MSIRIEEATKIYGSNAVVNHVSLEVAAGEFLVLIGPSGSGKSTLLRMIAGLSDMDAGRITLNGRDVTALPPQQRGVGFVFQNYALFRHMSAAQNIEYGLQVRGVNRAKRQLRVEELLELVGLMDLGRRLPSQMSGGQQQRVALARALAFNPDILLLDEPFGALDAKIRTELRRSIKRIQREVGVSTIFVTHDQEEAFALADRVGVMHDGELVELGPAEELYQTPRQDFTATFLGGANLLLGVTSERGVRLGEAEFPLLVRDGFENHRLAKVLVRPEDITVSKLGILQDGRMVCTALVSERTFVGASERLRLAVKQGPGLQVLHPTPVFGEAEVHLEAQRTRSESLSERLAPGDEVYIGFRRVHCLEILKSLPVLGGRHAIQFLEAARRGDADLQDAASPGSGPLPITPLPQGTGADTMEIDADKVLIWFGEPKRIERVLIHLSGDAREDRDLIQFVKQTFAAGRPPSIELLHVQQAGTPSGQTYGQFMSAAERELKQLGAPVRVTQKLGDPLQELRRQLGQSDFDLVVSDLPTQAAEAHANGELSLWVTHHFGPVSSMFFLPLVLQPALTEEAA